VGIGFLGPDAALSNSHLQSTKHVSNTLWNIMSKDFIAFDPSGVDSPSSKLELLEWIHSFIGEGRECSQDMMTKNLSELMRWASEKYGSTVDEESQWACWPPTLLASGHHCTFHLCPSADAMTFMMIMSDQCKRLGLVMIDPSGRDPFITIPSGGGILD